jgi:hypothetical protein
LDEDMKNEELNHMQIEANQKEMFDKNMLDNETQESKEPV